MTGDALKTTPWWWEDAPPAPSTDNDPPHETDLAIIGAGFTGLSAALTAARKGAQVAVFDAQPAGHGASTRNGGMIGAPHRPGFVDELKTYGEETGYALAREGMEAYAFTRHLYENGGFDTGFRESGRIQLANSAAHFEAQKKRADILNSIHPGQVQVVQQEALPQHIASEIYHGGLLYPDHGGVQPAKAHGGLLAKAMEAGATVYAPCAVANIERSATGFTLITTRGTVKAQRLVIATNGYTTPAVSRHLARRIFPLTSFIIATEELGEETVRRVAPGLHMMVESRARHSYFRPSPDGKRILFGGRAALVPSDPSWAARKLHRTMVDIWPEAEGWRITHCWQGSTGFTFARIPHVGEHEGAHFAYGYCGNGVALSPWFGHKLALRALGDPKGDTAYAKTRLVSRFYHTGSKPWFLQIASPWWNQVVDRWETHKIEVERRRS
ncbi:MAG: FAD-binding oxidoreductase [Pseudomonadota bacterium]